MKRSPHLVGDVMSRRVVAVDAAAPYKEIAGAMAHWQVSALPVVGGDGRVSGIVSATDLLFKEELRDPARQPTDPDRARARTAGQLMTSPAVGVRSDTTLAQAARTMDAWHVTHLPVVDEEGRPLGMLSRSDVLRAFLRPDADIADEIRDEVVSRLYPGAERDIAVTVREGVVTLAGRVPHATAARRAAHLAFAVEGVVDIETRLDWPDGWHAGGRGRHGDA